MEDSPAARLANRLRAVMKDRALSGAQLAEKVGQLTGTTPSSIWASRRFPASGEPRKALIKIDPELFAIAAAIGVDRIGLAKLLLDAIFPAPTPLSEDDIARVFDVPAAMLSHVPRRDSDVAAWIKRHRDDGLYPEGVAWHVIDSLLEDYRLHADTGTPLSQDVQGPHGEE